MTTTANQVRGEVELDGPEGKKFKLCLTLGAMAELERELGIENITEIGERFKKPKMSDVTTIILCLLHGGGHKDVTREQLEDWPFNMKTSMAKITEAFGAAGLRDDDEDEAKTAEPKQSGN